MLTINVMTPSLASVLRTRRWRDKNPDYEKTWRQKAQQKIYARAKNLSRYGLTIATWEEMFNRQNRCCAICKSPVPKSKRGWHTDHDHITNRVRGILCNNCNIGLAGAEDSLATLTAMIVYLGGTNAESN